MGKKKTSKKKQDTKPNYPEVQETIGKSKDNDEEQRRSTRLGALLVIVAAVWAICNFSWKLLEKTFSVVPQGILFWWLAIGFSIVVTVALFILFYIICFIATDLQRHNLKNPDYKSYDEKSDNRFKSLVDNTIIYLQILCFYMASSLIIEAICSDGRDKLEYIVIIILFSIMFLVLLYMYRKEMTKDKVWKALKKYGCKFIILVFVSSLCLVSVINIVYPKTATINVLFESDGQIVLQNSSGEFDYNMQIEVDGAEGGVYKNNVEISNEDIPNLLRSREEVYDMSANTKDKNEEKDNNVIPEKEQLYWKYIIDLNDEMDKELDEGRTYDIVITVDRDKKSYEVFNQFYIANGQYVFCIENITKTY